MKSLIFTVILLCSHFSTLSQTTISSGYANPHDMENWLARNKLRHFNEENNAIGDMYYSDWSKGSIKLKAADKSSFAELRYNELTDELLLKFQENIYVLTADKVENFTLEINGGRIFIGLDSANTIGFFELAYKGNAQLLVKHTTRLIKRDTNDQAYGSGVAYDKYVKDDEMYLVKQNELIPFEGKKKQMELIFGERIEEVNDFMKTKKLSLKKREDVVMLLSNFDI